MCYECFLEYTDEEPVWNERVAAVAALMKRVGDETLDYDPLTHVITSDMNLDDRFFELEGDAPYVVDRKARYDAAPDGVRQVFDALKGLTVEERATAVAHQWGYVDDEGRVSE